MQAFPRSLESTTLCCTTELISAIRKVQGELPLALAAER